MEDVGTGGDVGWVNPSGEDSVGGVGFDALLELEE